MAGQAKAGPRVLIQANPKQMLQLLANVKGGRDGDGEVDGEWNQMVEQIGMEGRM